jgi:hypothetical protein
MTRRAALPQSHEAKTRRILDGVVASYIRDISERTASASAPRARQIGAPGAHDHRLAP